MVKQSKAAQLVQQLQDWSDEELGDLAEMIQRLFRVTVGGSRGGESGDS